MAKAKAQGIPSQHRFDDGTKHGNARRAASPPSAPYLQRTNLSSTSAACTSERFITSTSSRRIASTKHDPSTIHYSSLLRQVVNMKVSRESFIASSSFIASRAIF